MAATIELVLAMKLRCDSITPRGFPVEPEVLRVHRRCLLAQRIESLRGGKDDPRGGDRFRWNAGLTVTARQRAAHQRIRRDHRAVRERKPLAPCTREKCAKSDRTPRKPLGT